MLQAVQPFVDSLKAICIDVPRRYATIQTQTSGMVEQGTEVVRRHELSIVGVFVPAIEEEYFSVLHHYSPGLITLFVMKDFY